MYEYVNGFLFCSVHMYYMFSSIPPAHSNPGEFFSALSGIPERWTQCGTENTTQSQSSLTLANSPDVTQHTDVSLSLQCVDTQCVCVRGLQPVRGAGQ